MVNTVWVNADHGRDFHPLANHMGEILEFSAFPFLLHLLFDQMLSNLIICLMVSQKLHTRVAQTS